MNKIQFIEAVAESADVPKTVATSVLDAAFDIIKRTISDKDEVAITGFGKFASSERAARTGRDPRTGNPIEIAARTVPVFKAGKELKEAVNEG